MKYNKTNKIPIFSLCVIFLYMLTFFSLTSIATSTELGVGDLLTYEVLESSGTENVFYGTWPPGTYFGNWSVVPNDQIRYNITSITKTDINGTLFLGNALTNSSFHNVRNVFINWIRGYGGIFGNCFGNFESNNCHSLYGCFIGSYYKPCKDFIRYFIAST